MPESNSSTDPDGHVLVGIVGKPHGLDGHVFVIPESDNPDRFVRGSVVYLEGEIFVIRSSRVSDGRLIVAFEGIEDRNVAEGLRGERLTIPESDRRTLGEDEWWPEDLISLTVLDHTGTERGSVVDVVEGVAQHRLVVRTTNGASCEIPFVADLVPVVDLDAGHIRLAEVEGLFPDD